MINELCGLFLRNEARRLYRVDQIVKDVQCVAGLAVTGESADGKAGKDRFLSAFFAWLIELIQMITRWFTK